MTDVDIKRPLVGRLDCADCGQVAGLYKMRRGRLKELLYKRCGCGCDQRTGAVVQDRWRSEMVPESGYEYLKVTGQVPEVEPDIAPEVPEVQTKQTKQQPNKKGLFLVLAAIGAGLFAVIKG